MIEIFLLIAGIGAGIVTGLFGGSATLAVVPIMVVFAGYSPYLAVGLGLAIDVTASAVCYFVYRHKKPVELKRIIPFTIFALVGTVFGSFYAVTIQPKTLILLSGLGICFASLKFLKEDAAVSSIKIKNELIISSICGLLVGLFLGIWGTGGGILLLLVLTLVLKYETHDAVQISVFIMIFLAFFGAVGHYINMSFSFMHLLIGSVGAIIGGVLSSKIALSLSTKNLNRIITACLLISGISLILKGLGVY